MSTMITIVEFDSDDPYSPKGTPARRAPVTRLSTFHDTSSGWESNVRVRSRWCGHVPVVVAVAVAVAVVPVVVVASSDWRSRFENENEDDDDDDDGGA